MSQKRKEVDGTREPATMRAMKERPTSGTPLSRRFCLVLLHLAEEARRDLDSLAARPVRAIHALRRRMKNLRALLLLVKPRTPKAARKSINALAGSLKDAFSELRDAHVISTLRAKFSGRRESPAKTEITPKAVMRNKVAKADVTRLTRMVSKLDLKGLSWTEVFDGYLRSYRAGRKAMKMCKRKPAPETFHEWRRPVKDLFYQSQALQPLDGMKARRRWADKLGDRLGMLNDLHLLHAETKKSCGSGFLKDISKTQRALHVGIFKMAAKLFGESPRKIAGELERCVKFQPASATLAVRQT